MYTAIRSRQFIGQRIKEKRRSLGMTQGKLAEEIGVTYQQIQRYENGSNMLNVEKLQLIATALKVSIGFFFGEGEAHFVREEGPQLISAEEEQALQYLRQIKSEEYKKSILLTIEMAWKAEKSRS